MIKQALKAMNLKQQHSHRKREIRRDKCGLLLTGGVWGGRGGRGTVFLLSCFLFNDLHTLCYCHFLGILPDISFPKASPTLTSKASLKNVHNKQQCSGSSELLGFYCTSPTHLFLLYQHFVDSNKRDSQVQVEHGKFRTTMNKREDVSICDMLILEQALNPPPVPPLADILQDWNFPATHLLCLSNVVKFLQAPLSWVAHCQASGSILVSSFSVP